MQLEHVCSNKPNGLTFAKLWRYAAPMNSANTPFGKISDPNICLSCVSIRQNSVEQISMKNSRKKTV